MKFYAAVTDQTWFKFLSEQPDIEEVNFWTPRPWGGQFGVASKGGPFLFKLKAPYNAIAGGGYFEHYTELPISLAWDAFEEKNGASTLEEVRQRTGRLRRVTPRPWEDFTIGCIIVVEPFFWPEDMWIRDVPGWHPNIQRGRSYELASDDGRQLWQQVSDRIHSRIATEPIVAEAPDFTFKSGFTEPVLQPRRVGQGTFRAVILDVYHRRCAITQERALPTLDAAHIRDYSEVPLHYVQNGILLRADIHRLFDKGYLTVTPDYRVEVSHRIHDDFDNGENYIKLTGRQLSVPEQPDLQPSPEILTWHNENRYRG
ncbi:HNH endonuclease [Gemmatimonadota bacterium]